MEPTHVHFSLAWLLLVLSPAGAIEVTVRPSDILNVEYLPSTLLLEEAVIEKEMADIPDNVSITTDGDLRDAFLTMQFHRSKMNEYMCRVYVADEILSELGEDETSRRGAPAAPNHRTSNRDHLLSDQGSSSYKDWLSRSTLLDDVYRHYDSIMSGSEDVEAGEVTGYAVQQGGGKTTGSGHGYSASGGGSYGPPPPHSFNPHPVAHSGGDEHIIYHHHGQEESHHGKSLALKDLFDLALTALAFLAFGTFVMNLILTCIIGGQGTTIVMQTTTTTTTSTGTGTGAGGAKHRRRRRRRRRDTEDELNEMAYRVSRSVEEVLGERRHCLRYSLCKDNRHSRKLVALNRIWLPLWSFGLSWVSGHVGGDRLANLRGSVLGLGAANCEEVYPKCIAS